MKFLVFLFVIAFALVIAYVDQDVFAACSMGESCHVWEKSSSASPVDGLKYSLDSPDL